MNEYVYQVVRNIKDAEMFETKEELLLKYKQQGIHESSRTRQELQGQPQLEGLLGPMYNGKQGDKTVIRYETQAAYNAFSI